MLMEEDIKKRISWMEQCSEGKGNPNHAQDLREFGFCGACGESKVVEFKKGDFGIILRDEDGRVIAGLKGFTGAVIQIIDYPKAKELAVK